MGLASNNGFPDQVLSGLCTRFLGSGGKSQPRYRSPAHPKNVFKRSPSSRNLESMPIKCWPAIPPCRPPKKTCQQINGRLYISPEGHGQNLVETPHGTLVTRSFNLSQVTAADAQLNLPDGVTEMPASQNVSKLNSEKGCRHGSFLPSSS